MNPLIVNFEKMLAAGKDTPLLRFGLGNAYLAAGDAASAAAHLKRAVEQKPDYSAAWKLLGKALATADDRIGAIEAYRHGIEVAEKTGDKQAMKEMKVFVTRLERSEPEGR